MYFLEKSTLTKERKKTSFVSLKSVIVPVLRKFVASSYRTPVERYSFFVYQKRKRKSKTSVCCCSFNLFFFFRLSWHWKCFKATNRDGRFESTTDADPPIPHRTTIGLWHILLSFPSQSPSLSVLAPFHASAAEKLPPKSSEIADTDDYQQ